MSCKRMLFLCIKFTILVLILKLRLNKILINFKKRLAKKSNLCGAMFSSASRDLKFSDWQKNEQRFAPSVDIQPN